MVEVVSECQVEADIFSFRKQLLNE